MSAMQRRKGAEHERSVVKILREAGHDCARNLDQARDGGGDIPFGEWLIECKRRKSIAIYPWWNQVKQAVMLDKNIQPVPLPPCKKPALVIRADKRENLVVIRLEDFMELVNRAGTEASPRERTG